MSKFCSTYRPMRAQTVATHLELQPLVAAAEAHALLRVQHPLAL